MEGQNLDQTYLPCDAMIIVKKKIREQAILKSLESYSLHAKFCGLLPRNQAEIQCPTIQLTQFVAFAQ